MGIKEFFVRFAADDAKLFRPLSRRHFTQPHEKHGLRTREIITFWHQTCITGIIRGDGGPTDAGFREPHCGCDLGYLENKHGGREAGGRMRSAAALGPSTASIAAPESKNHPPVAR